MARPLRIEYPGALYHVTSRGNERKDGFTSQRDREKFLSHECEELRPRLKALCGASNRATI